MKNLKSILKKYYTPGVMLGSETEIEPNILRNELRQLRKRINSHYWFSVAMVGLVFIIGLVVLLTYIKEPSHAAAIFGAMGISVSGAVEYMRRLWKEMSQINLVIILASELDTEKISAIVEALIKKI